MSHKRIAYTRASDGGVSIITPADEFIKDYMAQGKTEAQAIAFIKNKDVPADATNVQIVNDTDLPPDRTYRNLWRAQ